MKPNDQLISLIPKLEPVEFMGLARVLRVKLFEEKNPSAEKVEDKYAPREFSDVLEELMMNFNKLNRARKREILKLVKNATAKMKVKKDAGNTENTEVANGD